MVLFFIEIFWQGKNADALALYFGEDPTKCPLEQGMRICISFIVTNDIADCWVNVLLCIQLLQPS